MTWDLENIYLALDGAGGVKTLPVGPDFWATVDSNPDVDRILVAAFGGEGDWPHWEMHPEGEEVLILLEGEMGMIFEGADGAETLHPMRAGSTLVVPRGVWHRGVDQQGVKLMAMTWGAGTTHKPIAR